MTYNTKKGYNTVRILTTGRRKDSLNNHLKLDYLLIFDEHTKRKVIVTGPATGYSDKGYTQGTMTHIMRTLLRLSGVTSLYMSYSDFLNLEFKKFKNINISNELL